MRVRLAAAVVLAACLFLPLSTCSYRGQTKTTIPIRDLEPVAVVVLVFCGPLILIVAERLRPPSSPSGVILLALQIPDSLFIAYQIFAYTILETPLVGFYVSYAALILIFIPACVELVHRLRSHAPAADVV